MFKRVRKWFEEAERGFAKLSAMYHGPRRQRGLHPQDHACRYYGWDKCYCSNKKPMIKYNNMGKKKYPLTVPRAAIILILIFVFLLVGAQTVS